MRVKRKAAALQAFHFENQPRAEWPAWVNARSCRAELNGAAILIYDRQVVYLGEWLVAEPDGAAKCYSDEKLRDVFDLEG